MDAMEVPDTKQAVWAEISLERLAANYGRLCAAAAGAEVMAVVKGDAYGHGGVPCASALLKAGAKWLGVTSVAEGVAVRKGLQGTDAKIFIMRSLLPHEAGSVMEARLTPAVWALAQLDALEAAAAKVGATEIAIHLEIDSGMSRQGVANEQLPAILEWLASSSRLRLEGVMTHFAAAEDVASPQNTAQADAFTKALETIRAAGLKPEWIHAGSTSTVDAGVALSPLRGLAKQFGAQYMCRTGIGLYGYAPSLTGGSSHVKDDLEPVLAWKTQILSVQDVAAGALVGYNGTFTAERPMRLALLPLGYADGLRRELSNTGEVLIAAQRARIVGRVSMDVTIVDITAIPDAKVGDEVVVLGTQGSECITAGDHARIAGTISYEILCGIGARVQRYYE